MTPPAQTAGGRAGAAPAQHRLATDSASAVRPAVGVPTPHVRGPTATLTMPCSSAVASWLRCAKKRRKSSRLKRRCPPGVRNTGISPLSAHVRKVVKCTPKKSLASFRASHCGSSVFRTTASRVSVVVRFTMTSHCRKPRAPCQHTTGITLIDLLGSLIQPPDVVQVCCNAFVVPIRVLVPIHVCDCHPYDMKELAHRQQRFPRSFIVGI